jgi:hypothetical protein
MTNKFEIRMASGNSKLLTQNIKEAALHEIDKLYLRTPVFRPHKPLEVRITFCSSNESYQTLNELVSKVLEALKGIVFKNESDVVVLHATWSDFDNFLYVGVKSLMET